MFREMRRKEKLIATEEVERILKEQKSCVLAVNGDDGYPYSVPLNYGYVDGKFYMHSSSRDSHKCESIEKNPKVCVTVIAEDILKEELYDTHYTSVIAFGTARVIRDNEEKTKAMLKMMHGLSPKMEAMAEEHCRKKINSYVMIEVTPEHITGKLGR